MPLFSRRSHTPRLATPSRGGDSLEAPGLRVDIAQALIIVTLPASAASALVQAAASARALSLHSPQCRVFFEPVKKHTRAVKDPKRGWVIPLDPPTRAALAATVEPEPGEYEISEFLALEVTAC